MDIKILGTGCPRCKALERATIDAVKETGLNATVSKVEDIMEIMKFGVMTTPALVINGQVVVKGKVPSVNELKDLFIQKL
ncbi:MAG: TM0996/MTH895 family glutaredoxin-like protein [Bacteroidales bacterium]|nr:TM0996/MTH895 family glutaredoxin-like protein [Bacteroidales bacterium]